MKSWSSWFPDLRPQLLDCPDPLIEHELRRACQEFFSRTRAWQVVQDLVPVSANQSQVDIDIDDSAHELVRIERAWLDGTRLNVVSASHMDMAFTDDWQIHTGSATTLVQITAGSVALYPIPISASVSGLKLRISVKPSDAATGIPDDMASSYKSALAAGALSRLMLQAGTSWANPSVGSLKAAVFYEAINAASIHAARSFGSGRIASRPKFF